MNDAKFVRPIVMADAVLTSSNVAENALYAEWNSATTYGLADYCYKASTHRLYKSLQAGNTNHDPATEPATPVWWQDMSATDRWLMFDDRTGSQTSNATSIAVVLAPGARFDTVALFNIDAASVQITVTDPTDGVVFDQTYSLVSTSGIDSWWSYFMEPVVRKTELVVSGIPPYSAASVAITLSNPGGTAKCGECIVGLSRSLGAAHYNMHLGIDDYSVKQADEFGNWFVQERTFSDRIKFTLAVERENLPALRRQLNDYRATPLVWIASEGDWEISLYGFFNDYDVDVAYANVFILSLDLEGL